MRRDECVAMLATLLDMSGVHTYSDHLRPLYTCIDVCMIIHIYVSMVTS